MSDDGDNVIPFPGRESGEGVEPRSLSRRDPARQIARQLYLGLRPQFPTPVRTVAAVLEALAYHRQALPAEAPPSDVGLIGAWSAEDDWEGRYQASRAVEVLSSPAGDAQRYLADLQYQLERARDLLQGITAEMDGPPPVDHKPGAMWPEPSLVNRWRSALSHWQQMQAAVTEAREGVVRASSEGTRSDYWMAEQARIVDELHEHYTGGGPQYDLLVNRLAALDVRLRQVERSPRDIASDEYRMLHDLHLKYVAQLQKHTEATKSESVQPVQDAIKKIVALLERRIKPLNPQLWGQVVEDIVRETQEMGAA